MPSVRRNAVVYRHGLNKMSKDKRAGIPGYAPCSNCKKHYKVLERGQIRGHEMHRYVPCPSRKPVFESAVVSLNKAGIGQQKLADFYGVTRHKIRTILKEEK